MVIFGYDVTGVAHVDCADCARCAESAVMLARVRGSHGGSMTAADHSATVSRMPRAWRVTPPPPAPDPEERWYALHDGWVGPH